MKNPFKTKEQLREWLSTLSEEKKKEYARLAIIRKKRVEDWALDTYRPHDKQRAFHNTVAKIRLFRGGNRSGKTVGGAAECCFHSTLRYPDWWKGRRFTKPTSGWVVSLDNNVQLDVAQREVAKWLPKADIDKIIGNQKSEITYRDFRMCFKVAGSIYLKNGSVISFKNCESGRDKFQGTSKHYIWMDEEPPRDIFEECLARTVDCEGIVLITMTPLKGYTWAYHQLVLKDGNGRVAVFQVNIEENPYLPKQEIKDYVSGLSEKEKTMRAKGDFCAIGGLVFDEFNRNIHVIEHIEPDDKYSYYMGMDFGTRHETAVVYIAIDYCGNIYIFDEYYENNQDFETHAQRIKIKMGNRIFKRKVMDSAATQAILEFNRKKMKVEPVKKLKGFKETARSFIKKYLKDQSLFISNQCVNTIYEFEHYRYKEEKEGANNNEEVIKSEDHLMDALQYIIFMLKYKVKEEEEEEKAKPWAPKYKYKENEKLKKRNKHSYAARYNTRMNV